MPQTKKNLSRLYAREVQYFYHYYSKSSYILLLIADIVFIATFPHNP